MQSVGTVARDEYAKKYKDKEKVKMNLKREKALKEKPKEKKT